MSEQWQGLHNPNQHKRYKDECRCVGCGDYEWCASEYPCRCCLAAEVEVLRAQVQRVRDLCDALRRTHQDYAAMVIEMTLDGGESDE
jgi:hypothetical protein